MTTRSSNRTRRAPLGLVSRLRTARSRRPLTVVLAALAAGVLCSVMVAAPAQAATPKFGAGCTPSSANPSGTVCLTTGSVTRISRTTYAGWENLCGYRALLLIRYPDGRGDYRWSTTHAGCSTGFAWFDFGTNFDVPKGTRMCGTFFQNNQITTSDGTACRYVS